MLRKLAGVADRMILTRPASERAADPQELASFVRPFVSDPLVIPTIPEAVVAALDQALPSDLVCITGSLYTVGEAKAFFDDKTGLMGL